MPPPYREPFRPGDVVWGPDAFHEDDPHLQKRSTRPWLVVSNESFPGQGEQYVCCGLTHNLSKSPAFIVLDPKKDWQEGGTPKPSQIDTETLFTMKQRWITSYSGSVTLAKLQLARKVVKSYL